MKKKLLVLFLLLSIIFIGNPLLIAKQPELSSLEKLGQLLYTDQNLSLNGNQSCQTCHHQAAKFVDPENRQDPVEFPVSDGSNDVLFGGRNAPSAAYAKFSPNLQWDVELFIGGQFWDGRASGNEVTDTGGLGAGPTYDPLADQAKGPFQNPVEMALSSDADVVNRVLASNYADNFLAEYLLYYGEVYNPLTDEGLAYNFIAIAIAEFEKSYELNKFSSRFDGFLAEQGGDVSSFGVQEVNGIRQYVGPPAGFKSKYLSYDEADGLAIFNADSYQQLGETNPGVPNGGMCYLCHLTEAHDENTPPVFTDFSYDNLGVPVNPQIETLAGTQPIDYGLGAQTAILDDAYGSAYGDTEEWCKYEAKVDDDICETVTVYPSEIGKFKEPTLRNIAKTAPYFHNGVFATLEEVVTFYNRRDELGFDAEVEENVNDGELGNLGLTDDQERKLVLFMRTLTDE